VDLFSRKTQGGVIYTPPACEVKVTEGGAVQYRWRLPTGGKMSLSIAPPDGKVDKQGHYHKGLTEVYSVHAGQLVLIQQKPPCGLAAITIACNDTFVVFSGVCHAIIQTPGTVFVTQTIGTPVPNVSRKGNDWYPAEGDFNLRMRAYFSEKGYKM